MIRRFAAMLFITTACPWFGGPLSAQAGEKNSELLIRIPMEGGDSSPPMEAMKADRLIEQVASPDPTQVRPPHEGDPKHERELTVHLREFSVANGTSLAELQAMATRIISEARAKDINLPVEVKVFLDSSNETPDAPLIELATLLNDVVHEDDDPNKPIVKNFDVYSTDYKKMFPHAIKLPKDQFREDAKQKHKPMTAWFSVGRAFANGVLTGIVLGLNDLETLPALATGVGLAFVAEILPAVFAGAGMGRVSLWLQQNEDWYSRFLEKKAPFDTSERAKSLGWRVLSEAWKTGRHSVAIAAVMGIANGAFRVGKALSNMDASFLVPDIAKMGNIYLTALTSAFSFARLKRVQTAFTEEAYLDNLIRNHANSDEGHKGADRIYMYAQFSALSISITSVIFESLNLNVHYRAWTSSIMYRLGGASWAYYVWRFMGVKEQVVTATAPLRAAVKNFFRPVQAACASWFAPKTVEP